MKILIVLSAFLMLGKITAQPDSGPEVWGCRIANSGTEVLDSMIIRMNSLPLLDGVEVALSDDLGVFYRDLNGDDVCVGFLRFSEDSVLDLVIYNDGSLSDNTNLRFRLWHAAWDCEIRWSYWVDGNWNAMYTPGIKRINRIAFTKEAFVIYDTLDVCQGEALILSPQIEAAEYYSPISFITNDMNLVLGEGTGEVNVDASVPGAYQIIYRSRLCLRNHQDSIIIRSEDDCADEVQTSEEQVISPASPFEEYRSVFFEENEMIEIFNNAGQRVNAFQGPFRWFGEDENGNLLPTDEYYIKIGEAYQTITILR